MLPKVVGWKWVLEMEQQIWSRSLKDTILELQHRKHEGRGLLMEECSIAFCTCAGGCQVFIGYWGGSREMVWHMQAAVFLLRKWMPAKLVLVKVETREVSSPVSPITLIGGRLNMFSLDSFFGRTFADIQVGNTFLDNKGGRGMDWRGTQRRAPWLLGAGSGNIGHLEENWWGYRCSTWDECTYR